MARVGNGWNINHAKCTDLLCGNSKIPSHFTFCYRRTTSGALNSLSGLRMAAVGGSCRRRLNLMAGAIILATSARSVLGWSLCVVELVPTAVVVQMRRFGGTPDRNSMKATSTTVSAACRMVLRSRNPPRVAVICIV